MFKRVGELLHLSTCKYFPSTAVANRMQMFELTKLHVSVTNSLTIEETPVKPGLDANPNGVVKTLTSLHDHEPYFMGGGTKK